MLYCVEADTLDASFFAEPGTPIQNIADHFGMVVVQIGIH